MCARSIDLHDLTVSEALAEFVSTYNRWFADGYRDRIEVIHGYGSSGSGGAIRPKLRAFLRAHADRFRKITEGESLGNPGVTYVDPRGRLPESAVSGTAATAAARAILAFCAEPKSESKILIKLRGRFGDSAVRAAIRELVRNGALQATRAHGDTTYRAG